MLLEAARIQVDCRIEQIWLQIGKLEDDSPKPRQAQTFYRENFMSLNQITSRVMHSESSLGSPISTG